MESPFDDEPAAPSAPDRKERLLLAALALFDEIPFDEMAVDVVAERAGVAKGLVAYYFGNKAGLFRSVGERFSQQVRSDLLPVAADAAQWLVDDVDAFLALVEEHPMAMRNLTRSVHAAWAPRTSMGAFTVMRVMRALGRAQRSPLLESVIASWGVHCVDVALRWLDQPAAIDRELVAAVVVAELRAALEVVARTRPELGLPEHPLA